MNRSHRPPSSDALASFRLSLSLTLTLLLIKTPSAFTAPEKESQLPRVANENILMHHHSHMDIGDDREDMAPSFLSVVDHETGELVNVFEEHELYDQMLGGVFILDVNDEEGEELNEYDTEEEGGDRAGFDWNGRESITEIRKRFLRTSPYFGAHDLFSSLDAEDENRKQDREGMERKRKGSKQKEKIVLTTEPTEWIGLHEPLIIRWTHEEPTPSQEGSPRFDYDRDEEKHEYKDEEQEEEEEDRVIAMYCPADEPDPKKFRDVATLSQARASTWFHSESTSSRDRNQPPPDWVSKDGDVGSNLWKIPSFPIVHEDSCQFRLYRKTKQDPPLTTTLPSTPEDENDNHDQDPIYTFSLLATTSPIQITPISKYKPRAVHLSLTNNPSEMVIQFTTVAKGKPTIHYNNGKKVGVVTYGTTTTYDRDDLCDYPANSTQPGRFVPPGYLHTIILRDLDPDSDYTYRLYLDFIEGFDLKEEMEDETHFWEMMDDYDSTEKDSWQNSRKKAYPCHVGRFVSSPEVGGEYGTTKPWRYLAFGDQGCPVDGWAMGGNFSAQMIYRELDEAHRHQQLQVDKEWYPIRAIHHFGDLSYARGAAHLWDDWFDMISVYSSRVPLLVGIGNHEYDHWVGGGGGKDPSSAAYDDHYEDNEEDDIGDGGFHPYWGNFRNDSGGECGVPVSKRFYTPQNGNGVFWYSYDYANMHTIMISSEHDLKPGSVQYEWLENDLKSVDRKVTPWLVIESHRPMYMSEAYWHENIVAIAMRHEFETLLHRYKVDLFLAGHYHSYMRSCDGLFQSTCGNGGPTHIVVGTAGARLSKGFLYPNDWTRRFLIEWGYGRVTVYNSTTLHWEFVSDNGDTAGEVMDDAWIVRDRSEFH